MDEEGAAWLLDAVVDVDVADGAAAAAVVVVDVVVVVAVVVAAVVVEEDAELVEEAGLLDEL